MGAVAYALIAARLAKRNFLDDEDPLIAEVARLWRPGPRWFHRARYRKDIAEAEAQARADVETWSRYTRLRDQQRAWNLIESSAALAGNAALFGAVAYALSH
ncbi:MAG: hypothetical protein QOJ66_3532 [Ilumatobacteraceae bacterium]